MFDFVFADPVFSSVSALAKEKRKHTKKAGGPKTRPVGKVITPEWQAISNARSTKAWKDKVKAPLSILASGQGESYDYGSCRTSLRVLLELIDETSLPWDPQSGKVVGLNQVFQRAATLTKVSAPKLRELFNHFVETEEILISDNSIRGRGSPNTDRTALRKLNPAVYTAIKNFIDYRNSSESAGKVCGVLF